LMAISSCAVIPVVYIDIQWWWLDIFSSAGGSAPRTPLHLAKVKWGHSRSLKRVMTWHFSDISMTWRFIKWNSFQVPMT
jgi:hypothetical protein